MGRRYFGTDGVRGTANSGAMTADTVLKIGMAAGTNGTGDDAVSRCIYQLRRHLRQAGGDERHAALLETLPKRGYRLNGVAHVDGAQAAPSAESPPHRTRGRWRRLAGWSMALVALAIPVSIIALIVGHGHLRSRLRALESQVARQDLALQALAAGAPMAGPVDAVPPSPAAAAPPQPEPAKLTPWDRATGAVALVTPAEPNAPVELVEASVSTEPAEPALPRPPSALSRFAGWSRNAAA